jgi:hypothetical protein
VAKWAMETDSPILHSILAADPPPLFRVYGLIDWAYIFEKSVETNKTIKRIIRPMGTEHIMLLNIRVFLNAWLTFKNIMGKPSIHNRVFNNCMNFGNSSAFNTKTALKS